MQMEKQVTYEFSNGNCITRPESDLYFAEKYAKANHLKIIDIREPGQPRKQKGRIRDGFQPGWQSNIQAFAWSRGMYDRLLRQKGLIELGKEKAKESGNDIEMDMTLTDEDIREINNEYNLSLSDGDVRRIREKA